MALEQAWGVCVSAGVEVGVVLAMVLAIGSSLAAVALGSTKAVGQSLGQVLCLSPVKQVGSGTRL